MAYETGNVPAQFDAGFLQRELHKIRDAMNGPQPFAFLTPQSVAPAKPREGMIALADGTHWNPGSGAGYYGYFNGQWRPSGLPAGGLTKADVGLGNVDNTSDASKPISTATATALAGKQPAGSYQAAGNYVTRNAAHTILLDWVVSGGSVGIKPTIDGVTQNFIANSISANLVQFSFDGIGVSVWIDGTRMGYITFH